jgi:hypothetical protein
MYVPPSGSASSATDNGVQHSKGASSAEDVLGVVPSNATGRWADKP